MCFVAFLCVRNVVGADSVEWEKNGKREVKVGSGRSFFVGGGGHSGRRTLTSLARSLGFTSPDFVINGNQLLAGSAATFSYHVSVITTLDSGEEQTLSASASFSLSVNLSPTSGSCEVGPPEGFGLDTDFFISCHGWKDDSNSAISYEFIATTDSGQVITLQPTTTGSYELRAFNMPSPKVQ
jgi:hypothetical protein